MPPTRGHDLKQLYQAGADVNGHWMPPTRGHDLKLADCFLLTDGL